MQKGQVKIEFNMVTIGLKSLEMFKLNGLVKVTDNGLMNFSKLAEPIKHLEIAGCELITEFGIETSFKNMKNLERVNIKMVPAF